MTNHYLHRRADDLWALRQRRHRRGHQIAGVADVQVDLASGAVSIASESQLDTASVQEAVEEAGHELVTT